MKLSALFRAHRQTFVWPAVMIVTASLLAWRLPSMLPKLANVEVVLPSFHNSLQTIWNQPVNLPIVLSRLFIAAVLPNRNIAASRLPTVLLGFLLAGLGYWLIRRWYGQRLAIFGSVLLATAPWFLHLSRLANGDISFPLATMSIIVLAVLWHEKQRSRWLVPISTVIICLLAYVPGVSWLIICLKIVERRNVLASYRASKKASLLAGVLGLVTLTPLIHALIKNWRLYKTLLGLPDHWPTLLSFAKQFGRVWEFIFVRGYNNPVYNLGGLPIVSILISLAFLTGLYMYIQHLKASRTKLLTSLWIVGTLLTALQGPVNIAILLPIVLVLAVGGIGYWLHLWLKVFPRNPLARGFGISMIGLVIIFAAAYNLRNYFVAWPNAPATRAAFSRQL